MKYRVSFSGWAYVEANGEEEAKEKVMYEIDEYDIVYSEKECTSVDEVDEFVVCLED